MGCWCTKIVMFMIPWGLIIIWKIKWCLHCLDGLFVWSTTLLWYIFPLSANKQLNSLAPVRPECHFKTAIFNFVLLIGIFTSSSDNVVTWMSRDLTDGKSTLVQVMAWCRQATSHYLSQCWPRSLTPYGVTRPQWVNSLAIWDVEIILNL